MAVDRSALFEEIGDVCVFLPADKSTYINGQNILADGGMNKCGRGKFSRGRFQPANLVIAHQLNPATIIHPTIIPVQSVSAYLRLVFSLLSTPLAKSLNRNMEGNIPNGIPNMPVIIEANIFVMTKKLMESQLYTKAGAMLDCPLPFFYLHRNGGNVDKLRAGKTIVPRPIYLISATCHPHL